MNFPGVVPIQDSDCEFEVFLEDGTWAESESPAKRATEVLVLIPRGVRFKVDVDSYPGATCVRIPVGEQP